MKNSKQDYTIRDAVRKISDDDIRFLYMRLTQRFGGDIAESLVLIQDEYPDLHRLLSGTISADGVYDIVDSIQKSIQDEWKRRFAPAKMAPSA